MHEHSFTLEQLSKLTNSKLVGNPQQLIYGVADLDSATHKEASFLANARYEQAMRKSSAGVVFIDSTVVLDEGRNFLITDSPSRAFQQAIEAFIPLLKETTGFPGIHPSAVVHPTAVIGKEVVIGPHTVVEKGAVIKDRSTIGSGCHIGMQVEIGQDCLIHPHVALRERCKVGNRVIIQPGAVIGACGFGYTTDAQGRHTKLQHVGNVFIEDDVEIGANTVIERARFQTTYVKKGSKIGHLVIVGHNVTIGEHNIIISQAGIAGSTRTGRNVILAAQSGLVGHIKIADNVVLAAQGGFSKSITKPGKYAGSPALPLAEHNRISVHLRNIETYARQLQDLEKRLTDIEHK